MVRDLNNNFLDPLHGPSPRLASGRSGDAPKVNCATCHQGVYKPLFGVGMARYFPELNATH